MEERRRSDRRKVATDYRRRKLDRREKVFYYERIAYLTDTNYFQNVYFAQFLDFIGEAREDLFKHLLGNDFSSFQQLGIGISTVDCSIKYIRSLYLYDSFRIYIKISKIQNYKVGLDFRIVKTDTSETVATANMTVCFTKDGKPIVIPKLIKDKFIAYNLA